jgi:two-component system, OmpR family, sensor histidine kinase KdpD
MVQGITEESVSVSKKPGRKAVLFNEYIIAIILTALVTAAAAVLEPVTGYFAIALLYLLLVVAVGMKLHRGPALLVAASSALVWNFFFIPTRFSLHIAKIEDLMIFAMFFIVAIAMGHLTSQLRLNEMAERNRQQRTAALYELVHEAGLAHDLDGGLRAAISLTDTLFGVRASLVLRLPDHSLAAETHPASSCSLDEKEYKVAAWAFSHRMPAGRFTDTFSDSRALHLPLEGGTAVMGVLSIRPAPQTTIGLAEKELLQTFAVLIGTILEKDDLLQGAKRAEIIEATERLERALLQSVSHELKTPLSVVGTGISALAKMVVPNERSQATLHEIQQALRRLHRVINNLLNMTRIESGAVHPQLDWCDVGEIIEAVKDFAADVVGSHRVEVDLDRSLPMVRIDQPLLEQCLSNLLLNAASNSAAGSEIKINARVADDRLVISVRDEGIGVAESELPHIFETFYRGAEARPGGTGLGLAIVDGFTRALGGSVTAANKRPHGAEFVITIPVETLRPDVMEKLA